MSWSEKKNEINMSYIFQFVTFVHCISCMGDIFLIFGQYRPIKTFTVKNLKQRILNFCNKYMIWQNAAHIAFRFSIINQLLFAAILFYDLLGIFQFGLIYFCDIYRPGRYSQFSNNVYTFHNIRQLKLCGSHIYMYILKK